MLVDFIKDHGGSPFITDVVIPDPRRGYVE